MKRFFLLLLINLILVPSFAVKRQVSSPTKDDLIKVLIFSGKNNHEWKKTTPLLVRIFKDSKIFIVTVTEKPDTFSCTSLKKFHLVISNWNSWPDNKMRMSNEWETDFLRYINEGGGFLSFHAGASSFYDWGAYHRIGIGRWGKETSHGPVTLGRIYGFDQGHPVTKGMSDFFITDEIWEKSDIYPGSKVIGSLSAKDAKDGHPIEATAIFTNQTGKGRSFFTTLGHDERALLNTGLQTLLLRAAQWCAGRGVTINVPYCMNGKEIPVKDQLSWIKTDTSCALTNHSEILWQYNFNNRFGKSYFHPLSVKRSGYGFRGSLLTGSITGNI
jgi:type 1 glutamine amidotransferase